ncbi:molecular chaperone [Vibrio sp. qd031]|uniref:quaternary ammonium compound efflux SMR transporter SugE n=1 Tax=Vibrio sp. qd031 TaxID=1603038 RepID=UPI000A0FE493|nr:quaternary ammonium compound efflux SMR transporter SugE [Vibrio sp. qd031]ORT49682.1 molecular chaperone [Vibrio sp. qd031]
MHWIILVVAGLLEIGWAIGLKYSQGFTKLGPSIATVCCLLFSIVLLGVSMKTLPVGTAYAIWVGIGAIGTALFGIVLFDESTDVIKLVSLGLIFGGIIGLKLAHS